MKLTKERTNQLADNAKFLLTEAESEQFAERLSALLDYAEVMNEVDTTGVSPTAIVAENNGTTRKDEIKELISPDTLLGFSPLPVDMHMIKVQKTIN